MNTKILFAAISATAVGAEVTTPESTPTAEQLDFFEKKIRPVLVDKCYKCHSEKTENVKGGLVLDTREGIRRGGDSGPSVVPGDLKDSILIEAIRYHNKDFAMPPEKEGGKLPDPVIKDFETWVASGAPDPRDGAARVVKKFDPEEARKWWSFQLPKKGAVPQPKNAAWAFGDVDRFLLAAMESKNIAPVADAQADALLRRIFFTVVGLPPSPQQIGEFFADWKAASSNPQTARVLQQGVVAKWVDRLLSSPQYGERWGRHWLDVARYAESSGKDVNIAFPHAWRYRDYVIASFNADKPFDEFTREQVSGDLLDYKTQSERAEHLTATGFLALGPKGLNEQNARQFCLDLADEQIDAVTQAFMGMTVSCARCHDHKFDPISQREYYAMAGIFLSTETRYGTATGVQNRHSSELIELPAVSGQKVGSKTLSPAERKDKETRLAALKKEQADLLKERFEARRTGKEQERQGAAQLRPLVVLSQIGQLEAELKGFDSSGQAKALAMGVQDLPATKGAALAEGIGGFLRRGPQFRQSRPPDFASIQDARLHARGDADKPTDRVERGFPSVLTHGSAPAIPREESGREQLAEWLVAPTNPLTARVIVNRVWHWTFGRGLVESLDNFGTTGKVPDNQALLDFLAVKFSTPVAQGGHGWSVKKLTRELMLSHAFQLSSEFQPACFAADPENALLWRANKRRVDAESIRDAMLASSGGLDLDAPEGSLISKSGDAPIGGPRFRGISEEQLINSGGAVAYRSVYLPIARDLPPDALAAFDFSDPNQVTGARERTNVPSQALYILNNEFVAKCAANLADRVLNTFPSNAGFDQRLNFCYWLTLGRNPTPNEKAAAWNFLQKFPANWSRGESATPGLKDAEDVRAAWASIARALFATADFRYLN
jgi:hypothetical protein